MVKILKFKLVRLFIVLLVLLFPISGPGKNTCSQLNDNAGFFKPNEREIIVNRLLAIKEKTSAQVVIWTITSIKDTTLEDYSLNLARGIGLGQKGINNGILILLVLKDKKIRIEVGSGLEWILSDENSHSIIEIISPYFKQKEYFRGIIKGIDWLESQISKYDWHINEIDVKDLKSLNKQLKNKVISFYYSNKTGKQSCKNPKPTDTQFDKGFSVDLMIDHQRVALLYYSKHMGDLAKSLLLEKRVKIYSRVINLAPVELQLLGVLND